MHILASTSDPFTLTTVQVPNLELTHMKRITVCMYAPMPYHLTKNQLDGSGSQELCYEKFRGEW